MKHGPTALVVLRVAALVALAVSAALLVEYVRPAAAFCAAGGGCERVKDAVGGSIALPLLGVAGFASLLVGSLLGPRARPLLLPAATGGGAAAVLLILAQGLVVGAWCKLCLVVDVSAIVAALSALVLLKEGGPMAIVPPTLARLWLAAGLVSVFVPVAWSLAQPSAPVPVEIASAWEPGKLNVVEMMDFQCPYCRALHPHLERALASYGAAVHRVRLNMPLASHPSARGAARAYCCADEQGRGDAMADALFTTEDLSPAGCRAAAERAGVSLPAFDACVAGGAVDRRIDAEIARVRSAGFKGLPTVWIGEQMIVGVSPDVDAQLADALAVAAGKPSGPSVSSLWMWGGLATLAFAFAVAIARVGKAA